MTSVQHCETVFKRMTAVTEPTKRNPRKAGRKQRIKLDEDKALALRAQGATIGEIAEATNTTEPTVYRFLKDMKPEFRALEDFKANRADVFARLQAKAIDLQFKIVNELDGILPTLTPSQKAGLAHTLTVVSGTAFDKERLERGQSTQNTSIMMKMIHETVKGSYNSSTCKQVAVSTGDHNLDSTDVEPPGGEPAPDSGLAEEGRQGDFPAADVDGHPTESQRD